MPVDIPKHPSRYPIWMRQAIEAALDNLGEPVFAVEVEDEAHERSLRRYFRAFVKSLRANKIPQWDDIDHGAFCSCAYKLLHVRYGPQMWLELLATAQHSRFLVEKVELAERLKGSLLGGIFGNKIPEPPPSGK